ncbi:hypothetical protein SprV_0702334100 [Sparganum proliferum]
MQLGNMLSLRTLLDELTGLATSSTHDSKACKPPGRGVNAAELSDNPTGGTLYSCDSKCGRRFLVDTGAQISVIPPTATGHLCLNPDLLLQAVNTSPIASFGIRSLSLVIGLYRLFAWVFVVANVPCAIPSADFLAVSDLLNDCCQPRLQDQTTKLTVRGIPSSEVSHRPAVLDPEPENPFRQLLVKYPGFTRPNYSATVPLHNVVHHIRTTGPPVFSRPRRLAPARLAAAKAEFEHMLQMGIVRQSESPWASPLHMVPKAVSGDCRTCGDYRALNNVTIPDHYPVPHLQDFTEALFGKSVFSKIDLIRAFHQILIALQNVPKTAVTTPLGLFELPPMTFGLRNASQTFQRFVDRVLHGLPFVYAYIDELLIASSSAEEHMEHLSTLFDHFQKFCVVLNPSKCVFGVDSLECLGHLVDSVGIHPLPSNVEAIRDFPSPSSKSQLQRFLSMVKAALTGATHLTHFSPDAPISLLVDACNFAVGAVLQQSLPDSTVPLAFFSRKLSKAETRYSTFGRELLAVYLAVKHFRQLLQGREVTVYTDHKPLSFALHSTSDRLNPRETRQRDYISQFTSATLAGHAMRVADSLSGSSIAHLQLSPGINFAEMAAQQRRTGSASDENVSGRQL